MRDYNQINLGKLRNNPPKSRGSGGNTALQQQQQAQALYSRNHHLQNKSKSPNQSLDDSWDQTQTSTEEKKVDDIPNGQHSISNSNNKMVHSPKVSSTASLSTAPSTPPTALSDDNHLNNTSDSTPALSASDALAFRRDGAQATIAKLRTALDEAASHDSTSTAQLAKSDAVILELRSNVRQLQRKLDRVTEEKNQLAEQQQQNGNNSNNNNNANSVSASRSLGTTDDTATLDSRVGELQVQLDRAHAQILTADMVRKELEDTLEAEQYTWELRVQDQERQIGELQADCQELSREVESTRAQWKEAEDSWLRGKTTPRSLAGGAKDNDDTTSQLQQKIDALERERAELQGCLDEALKELEAVDEELKTNGGSTTQGAAVEEALRKENRALQQQLAAASDTGELVEPLQHLHRLVLERDGNDRPPVNHSINDPRALIAAIHEHIDNFSVNNNSTSGANERISELESQLEAYKADLQSHEESTSELRSSLKEAVSLLKPLQDTVARGEREKARLQQQLSNLQDSPNAQETIKELKNELAVKEMEVDRLRQEVQNLEIQLTRERSKTASALVKSMSPREGGSNSSSNDESPGGGARARLRAKRAEEQEQLKQMLDNARDRFRTLHQQNEDVAAKNSELQAQLVSPQDHERLKQELQQKESTLQNMQDDLKVSQGELAKKEVEFRELETGLTMAQETIRSMKEDDRFVLDDPRKKIKDLEFTLEAKQKELRAKRESEQALNRSLKEALQLLRPLQMHLQEAEAEKKKLSMELEAMRQQRTNTSAGSGDVDHVNDLEYAVTQLEKENSQLHDALEDMSQSLNATSHASVTSKNEGRLKEEIVEVKSRYEVTASRLQDAFVQNNQLVEELKKRDDEEKRLVEELNVLRKRLDASNADGQQQDAESSPTTSTPPPQIRPNRNRRTFT